MTFKAKSSSKMDISDCSANQQQSDGNELKFQVEDVAVDIMECGISRDEFQKEEQVLCQASSSSSFGDSISSRRSDLNFVDEDNEAQSMLSIDYPLPDETDFWGLTKKKLTDRWRRFSSPLAWRCKWLELKVKEIDSQARVYEKEVERHYETKMFDLEKSKFEGFEGKSIPFRHQTQRMKVLKRGRRRRVEETTDVAAYRANHNVFSYADKLMPVALKSRLLDLDLGTSRKASSKEGGVEEDCLASELDCSDDILVKALCMIDDTHKRARGLKERIDQLMWESQSDLTLQNGNQNAIVEEPVMPHTAARNQSVLTEGIGRKRVPQTPPVQIGEECLNNTSPVSSGGLNFHTILEDLLMDETDQMNDDDETEEANEEKHDYFRKLIDEITGVPQVSSEEADEEEDPIEVTKRRKTSH